jgi:hypothetical protein
VLVRVRVVNVLVFVVVPSAARFDDGLFALDGLPMTKYPAVATMIKAPIAITPATADIPGLFRARPVSP